MTATKISGKGGPMKRSRAASLFALLTPVALAGCASDADPPNLPCPQVAVLQQTQSLTAFLPGRSDVAAQITTAQITGVAGACIAAPGKARAGRQIPGRLLRHQRPRQQRRPAEPALLRRHHPGQPHPLEGRLHHRAEIRRQYEHRPGDLQAASRSSSPDHHSSTHIQILVGFELTPDQLAYAASHPVGGP